MLYQLLDLRFALKCYRYVYFVEFLIVFYFLCYECGLAESGGVVDWIDTLRCRSFPFEKLLSISRRTEVVVRRASILGTITTGGAHDPLISSVWR